jgi:hypothetical protein
MSKTSDLKRDRLSDYAHATRAQEGVHPASRVEEDEWVEGRIDPEPRPGHAQRWVRIDLHSQADNANVMKRFAEGWRPRPADTVPDAEACGYAVQSRNGTNVIVDRDRILCEMPIERAQRRAEVIDLANKRLNMAIEQDLNKHIPADQLRQHTRKTAVTVGKPRTPVVADDE